MTDLAKIVKNVGLSCVSGFLYVLINSLSAQALDFNFSIEGEEPSPGTVTGLIQGLKDNASSFPTKVIINKNSLGIPVGTVLSGGTMSAYFKVRNGKIVNFNGGTSMSNSSAATNYQSYYVLYLNNYFGNGLYNLIRERPTQQSDLLNLNYKWVRNYKGLNGIKYTLAH